MSVLRVKESFTTAGSEHVYGVGALVDADDPVVEGRESLFEPVEATVARQELREATAGETPQGVIEEATAEPNGRRSLRSRKPREKAEPEAPEAPAEGESDEVENPEGEQPAEGEQAGD